MTVPLRFCDGRSAFHASDAWNLRGLHDRQMNREDRARAELALDLERAAVVGDDVLDDGKTEPGAAELARAGGIDPVEALRQPRDVLGQDALAVVADGDQRRGRAGEAPGRGRGAHLDGGAGAAVLDG